MLYNLYVCDAPGTPVGGVLLLYADDAHVPLSGLRASILNRRMNNYPEVIYQYFVQWGFQLNAAKCNAVVLNGISQCQDFRSKTKDW